MALPPLYMQLPPVQCFTCGKPLSDKYDRYERMIRKGNLQEDLAFLQAFQEDLLERGTLQNNLDIVMAELLAEKRKIPTPDQFHRVGVTDLYREIYTPKQSDEWIQDQEDAIYQQVVRLISPPKQMSLRRALSEALAEHVHRTLYLPLRGENESTEVLLGLNLAPLIEEMDFLTGKKTISQREAFQRLGINRYCCRQNLISPAVLPFQQFEDETIIAPETYIGTTEEDLAEEIIPDIAPEVELEPAIPQRNQGKKLNQLTFQEDTLKPIKNIIEAMKARIEVTLPTPPTATNTQIRYPQIERYGRGGMRIQPTYLAK